MLKTRKALRLDYRLVALAECVIFLRLSWVTLVLFGGCYSDTVFAVGCEHALETGQVYPGLGHQRHLPGDEIQQARLSICPCATTPPM
jgi:hypothetical protein